MALRNLSTSLVELTGSDIVRARALFEAAPVNAHGFLFAVLEGNHTGRVFVDNATTPTAGLAHLTCEFSFLLGDAGNDAFATAAHGLLLTDLLPPPAPYGQMLFLVPTTDAWHADVLERYAAHHIDDIHRDVFAFDRERYTARHSDWQARIPDGFTLRPYDIALAESAGGLTEFWGSLDNFLAHGFGYAVMRGEEPVARCHAVFCGAGEAEISIETSEAYRRQGLATLAACAFIDHALEIGMEPAWSCWFNNDASVALAEHLGFVPASEMPVSVVIVEAQDDGSTQDKEGR